MAFSLVECAGERRLDLLQTRGVYNWLVRHRVAAEGTGLSFTAHMHALEHLVGRCEADQCGGDGSEEESVRAGRAAFVALTCVVSLLAARRLGATEFARAIRGGVAWEVAVESIGGGAYDDVDMFMRFYGIPWDMSAHSDLPPRLIPAPVGPFV
jgi:hypothetical protein